MIAFDHSRRARTVFWITLALVALAMGSLLVLLPYAGSERRWTIYWLPGTGPMAIGLGETGVYATLVTVGACLLTLAAARAEIAPASGALTLLALAGGAAALMAEHFLLRYVALEIVALCVALGPLAGRMDVDQEVDQEAERGRWTRLVYLALRVGDAGLLASILALWGATGTLEISPALEVGVALPPATLNWIAGGLLLAVWVKVGGWPTTVWQQAGALLPLFSRTWLYRTLMPTLGLYLLYRVTPLIASSTLFRTIALWVGALGATWAAVLLLVTRPAGHRLVPHAQERALPACLDAAMVFLGAAQGGLALVLAAQGLKTTVWLVLLLLTPLRTLLALAGDAAHKAATARGRRTACALFCLGGLALVALNALTVWWVRVDGSGGIPTVPRLVVEGAVGLIAAWVAVTAVDLWRGAATGTGKGFPVIRRWATLSVLACGLAATILWHATLLDHLAYVSRGPAYALPGAVSALRFLATSPALWFAPALALWALRRARRSSRAPDGRRPGRAHDPAQVLERGMRKGALVLRAVVEAGALSGALIGITRGILLVSHLAQRWIEGAVLEGATRQIAQTATESGRLAYRWIEGAALGGTMRQMAPTAASGGRLADRMTGRGGLEGLLRRIVRTVLAGSRWLQRRHTGRLRRNLVWVAASLVLALVALSLYVW